MPDQQPTPLTEIDLAHALSEAMDGNLRLTARRDLLDAYRDSIEARVHATYPAIAEDLALRAELCKEGDCPHAHQARKAEGEAAGYRHELEGLWDYLEDRDEMPAGALTTLRGILARALDW